ncbi:hypothetical protein Hanom_Chr17g01527111 [Helianthus anomalus]
MKHGRWNMLEWNVTTGCHRGRPIRDVFPITLTLTLTLTLILTLTSIHVRVTHPPVPIV